MKMLRKDRQTKTPFALHLDIAFPERVLQVNWKIQFVSISSEIEKNEKPYRASNRVIVNLLLE